MINVSSKEMFIIILLIFFIKFYQNFILSELSKLWLLNMLKDMQQIKLHSVGPWTTEEIYLGEKLWFHTEGKLHIYIYQEEIMPELGMVSNNT